MQNSLLRTENLVKIYKKRKVVNQLSVEVNPGEVVGLLGPNGAGKTTTFYMITGVIKPNAGKIFIGEEEITDLPMDKRTELVDMVIFRENTEDIYAGIEFMSGTPEAKKMITWLQAEMGVKKIR